jgi:hypothetical protein
MFTPGSAPSVSEVTVPVTVLCWAEAKVNAKPKRKSDRKLFLQKDISFCRVLIIKFIRSLNYLAEQKYPVKKMIFRLNSYSYAKHFLFD